jgi:ferrous iron transport protein B
MTSKYIALAGTPNCGKTSLFNALTGSHQRVGNYPGITVEKKLGHYEEDGFALTILDLPGLYSLDTRTLDERVAKNILLHKEKYEQPLDALVVVVDSTNLERSLYLLFELKKLNIPMIAAFNLWDIATARGQIVDLKKCEELLEVKIIATSAKKGHGISELIEAIKKLPPHQNINKDLDPQEFRKLANIKEIFSHIDYILKECVKSKIKPDTLSKRIDQFALHPFFGPLSLTIVLLLMFQAIFTWSAPVSDIIEGSLHFVAEFIKPYISWPILQSFLVDGIILGAGNVFVFLPQIIFLFLFILLLEDIGYLGRAALMMDSIMRRLGLPGKAVVPLLSSHACAVPGIMATRTIDHDKDRLVTMLVAPLMTCSARVPVYTLLIAAIVPNIKIWGVLHLQGLVMFCLYLLAIITSIFMAFILKKTVITGSASHLLLEIPGYRFPSARNIFLNIIQRIHLFIKKVGTIIITLSLVIWFLVTFPKQPDGSSSIENSYAASIGKVFTPIFAPIGFDWRLTTALIPTLGAREVIVSTLSTVLSVEGKEGTEAFDRDFATKVVDQFGLPSLISLLIWFVYSPQCISMISAFKRESGSNKWTSFMVGYTFVLAYICSFIAYRIALIML